MLRAALTMSSTRYRNGEKLLCRGPERHWWLTGFKWGVLSEPSELKMDVAITCLDATMTSAFVSAAWGLSVHYTTAAIPAIAKRVENPWDLKPGDALNKPGSHVMLFLRFTPDRKAEVMEASTGGCNGRVCRNVYPLASLLARGYQPVRFKALDGSCVIGPAVAKGGVRDPDGLAITVFVDGAPVQRSDTGSRIRSLAKLIADVTDFMTLSPGDLLLLGTSHGAPTARAGQRIAIEIDGLGRLEHTLANAAQFHPMEPHA